MKSKSAQAPVRRNGIEVQHSALLARIAATLPQLRPSERTVAERVLAQPNEVLHLSIAELARRVGASQPTVARFAVALGFSGYKEFKLRLAQSLASGVPFVHQDVGPGDALELVATKVFDRTIGALINVRNHLDPAALKRAVKILAGAHRIECYGVGNSAIVAAREYRAEVIAITPAASPLAKLASVALYADVPEDPDVYAPMTSRLAHLAILDVLGVGLALALGPALPRRLARTKQTLRDKRIGSLQL